jgi:hypothetical protein
MKNKQTLILIKIINIVTLYIMIPVKNTTIMLYYTTYYYAIRNSTIASHH